MFFIEKFTYLETDLRIFVRIERCDTGFGGSERFTAQTLFLILIEKDVIRHNHLCSLRDQNLRSRNASAYHFIVLFEKYRDIQGNPVSDHTCCMVIEHT